MANISVGNNFWKSVTMELISVGRKSFGKNFWRIKFSWNKFLNFIIFLVKTSVGKKILGKTFLWKKFLKLANPWTNLPLEKNSFGRMYFGKNFLKNNFFGKNYLGNFYFGKNPLDIFTGCRIWILVYYKKCIFFSPIYISCNGESIQCTNLNW